LYERETGGELLAEGRNLLSLDNIGSDDGETTTKEGGSYEREVAALTVRDTTRGEQKLDQPKKPLLILVTTTKSLLDRTSERIRTSWGSVEEADYRIIVGTEGTPLSVVDTPEIFFSTNHDFPAFPYLSIAHLSALVDVITDNFLEEYNWFLIAPSNIYVSVRSLERFLHGLNPYRVVYIGRPSNHSMPNGLHYCEGGPGIVLSHMAVRKLKDRLQGCVLDSKGGLGYLELGRCMASQLKTECSVSDHVSHVHASSKAWSTTSIYHVMGSWVMVVVLILRR
jgi:hypothetical protein